MFVVHSDDENLVYTNENDMFVAVLYKDKPFTGIVKDECEYIEYLNGNANGQHVVMYATSQIQSKEMYLNGEALGGVCFYENGQIQSESDKNNYKLWNLAGNLVQDSSAQKNIHYFNNGNIKSYSPNHHSENIEENFSYQFFNKAGVLTFTQLKDIIIEGKYVRKIIYEDQPLFESYFDLLSSENSELQENQRYMQAEKHRMHHITMWFWEVFDKDQKRYFQIINSLLTHPNLEIVQNIAIVIAIHKFEAYITPENTENWLAYQYIKENREYQDANFPDRNYGKVVLQ